MRENDTIICFRISCYLFLFVIFLKLLCYLYIRIFGIFYVCAKDSEIILTSTVELIPYSYTLNKVD